MGWLHSGPIVDIHFRAKSQWADEQEICQSYSGSPWSICVLGEEDGSPNPFTHTSIDDHWFAQRIWLFLLPFLKEGKYDTPLQELFFSFQPIISVEDRV